MIKILWQTKKFKFPAEDGISASLQQASQIPKKEAYFKYAAMMMNLAQRRDWVF
jgi:hypothetical protein